MSITKNAAAYWQLSSVRGLLVGGLAALSIFSLSSQAQAFHDGKEKYVHGQGILWEATRYKIVKPPKIRSEVKKDDAKAKKEEERKSSRELDMKIYVMGTFHVMLREIVKLPKPVVGALDDSRVAVFEQVFGHRKKFGRFVDPFLTDGRTLEMIMGSDDFQKFHAMGKRYNRLPKNYLNMLKPWAAWWHVGGVPRLREERKTGRPVLDDLLAMEAESRNMVTRALENTSEQLMAWRLMPEKEAVKLLRHTIKWYTPERATAVFNQAVKLYLKRDLDGLHKMDKEYSVPADADLEEYRKFHELFLDWRNENQVEQAIKYYKEFGGPMFLAVGAAHLPGERGVVNILKKMGFEVKRLY